MINNMLAFSSSLRRSTPVRQLADQGEVVDFGDILFCIG